MVIDSVACIGAGIIGQSWATLFSSKGLNVYLHDISREALIEAVSRIEDNLTFMEKNNLISSIESYEAMSLIKTTSSIAEAVGRVDYIQESVPDFYNLKKKVFKEIDAETSKHAIIASSSSSLLITEIQKVTLKPERCVLAHPILPPHLIPIIEIVGGEKTSKESITITKRFMERLGKVPIVLNKEVPGYIVNRLTAALWREAVSLVANGVASAEDVDKAFSLGIGVRDPLFGPCLRAHVAGGGIERFIKNYSQSYSNRWRSMETWTSIPDKAINKVTKSIKEMEIVNRKSLKEIIKERDEKLIEILKVISPEHPFYSKNC